MKYLLDTNVVIHLLKGMPQLTRRVRQCAPEEIGVSSIVMHELYFGAWKSARVGANLEVLDRLGLGVLSFNREDARQAGRVRAELAEQGTPIGPYDVLIAGQAAERGLVLITRNGREFSRVSGLRCEDWE
jgi:tRNA(fMet)-specific endonuclease VapC